MEESPARVLPPMAPYWPSSGALLNKSPMELLAVVGEQDRFALDHAVQMHGFAPEPVNIGDGALHIFQVKLNALVQMLDHQLTGAKMIAIGYHEKRRAAVYAGDDQLVANIFPRLVGDFPLRPFFSKT